MKRKVISVLLCAGMVFSLIGCSGSMGGSGGETADNETGDSNGNSGTVTLLSWYTEEEMSPIKEGFENANPGLTLEVQYVPPTEQYIQKLTLLMNGNEPTDLFFMCPEVREDVETTDFAEDLSDMPIMDKLSDNAKRTLGTDGKVYGLSLDSWASFIFYNEEIFEEAGIQEIPGTWDELVEAMAKINDIGIVPMTAQAEDAGRLLLGLFASNEASKDPQVEAGIADGSKKFSDLYEESMEAWYEDVVQPEYLTKACLSLTNDQQEEMFINGQAGMMIGGPWSLTSFEAKNPDAKYGTFAIPGFDGESMLQGAANVGIGIAKEAKNKEGAEKFMDYISSDEGIKCWSDTFHNFMNVEGVEYTVDPCLEQFKDDVAEGNIYWQTVEWPNSSSVLNAFTSACQNVIAGTYSPQEALQEIDDKIEEIQNN